MRVRPLTRRGAGLLALALALGVGGAVTGSRPALFFATLLTVTLAGAWLSLRLIASTISAHRRIAPEDVEVGDSTRVEVALRAGKGTRMLTVSWHDELPAGLIGDAAGAYPTGHGDTLTYDARAVTRGRWRFGAFGVITTDPLGLTRRAITDDTESFVAVTPRIHELERRSAPGGSGDIAQALSSRRGHGSDDVIPRPYSPGDELRRIHWRASARLGDLMVREEEQDSSPTAFVMLDLAARSWPADSDIFVPQPTDAGEIFEIGVSLAASVAWHLGALGCHVEVADDAGNDITTVRSTTPSFRPDRTALRRQFTTIAPRRSEMTASLNADDRVSAGYVVLIVGTLTPERVDHLVRTPVGSGGRTLLAADGAAEYGERLRQAGWQVGSITTGVSPSELWLAAA